MLGASVRIAKQFVPSGLRRMWRERRLQKEHGIIDLGTRAEYAVIGSSFGKNCRLSGRILIDDCTFGDYSYVETGCYLCHTDFGKFCSIAPYAVVGPASHPVRDFVSTHPAFYLHSPARAYDLVERDRFPEHSRTRVGNDVWIGTGAFVRNGVTVGDGAVIGAGAVVTTDVPPYAIYGGVPAKLIRHRFEPAIVRFLLDFRWWDRDIEWLRRHAETFRDIHEFVRVFSGGGAGAHPGTNLETSGDRRRAK
jgi:acetyltransferase-like isoleucine patch superfamily enzyme